MHSHKHYFELTALVISPFIWSYILIKYATKMRLAKSNFREQQIFSSYGLIVFYFLITVLYVLDLHKVFNQADGIRMVWLLISMAAMCILGAIDDVWGSREVGGFKGHFKKLFQEHKLTTGALKAFGGGIVALIAAWHFSEGDILRFLIGSLLIALTTNTINILDLRPGRASAAFFFILFLTFAASGWHLYPQIFVIVLSIITLIFYLFDRQAKIMMGDSGSNMLGSALGILIVINCGLIFQLIMVIMQLLLQLYSEKNSITKLIEQKKFLRVIDSKLGVR